MDIFEEKWSADVKTKWTPPEDFFTQSADKIASGLKAASDDLKTAMGRLNFYINRAGDNLSDEDKKKLELAKKKLSAMYESVSPMKMSEILTNIEEAMQGFNPGLNLKKGDIAVGQAVGHLWKASDELGAAGGMSKYEQILHDIINKIGKDIDMVNNDRPGYMDAVYSISQKVWGRGSKFPSFAYKINKATK